MTDPTEGPGVADIDIVNQMVALSDLAPHPRNYNGHSPEQLQRLRLSLKR